MKRKRDHSPLPIAPVGNGSNIVTMDLDEADLLMLAAGLAIARNTAIMCGGEDSARRLEYYREEITRKLPAGLTHIGREERLAEAIYAIREAGWWSHAHSKKNSWREDGETLVKCGDKIWSFHYSASDTVHQEIIEAVRQLVPMNAEERAWEGELKANQR